MNKYNIVSWLDLPEANLFLEFLQERRESLTHCLIVEDDAQLRGRIKELDFIINAKEMLQQQLKEEND